MRSYTDTRRQDLVAAGVQASDAEVVLIHDGTGPLITPEVIYRVAATAALTGVAVPVVAVGVSMRKLHESAIVEVIPRADLFRSQTPHGIRRDLLKRV